MRPKQSKFQFSACGVDLPGVHGGLDYCGRRRVQQIAENQTGDKAVGQNSQEESILVQSLPCTTSLRMTSHSSSSVQTTYWAARYNTWLLIKLKSVVFSCL